MSIRLILALVVAALLALAGCQDPFSDQATQEPGDKDTTVVLKPDTTDRDTGRPILPKPDTTKPIITNPDTAKPDTTKPIITNPDTAKPDTTKPKPVDTTIITNPDTTRPDTVKPKPVDPNCPAGDWQAGKPYNVGDVVRYPGNGKYYKCTNANPGYDPTISTWFWALHTCTGTNPLDTVPNPKPDTVKPDTTKPKPDTTKPATGFAALFTEAMFNSFFPNRNSFYTYKGLVEATASYPAFANTGDDATKKREVAAFLANVNHETGALVYTEEIAKGEYCGESWNGCACQPGKRYYGRGPLQISWNYNYGAAGQALGLPLCTDPDLVARDAKVAWQTALWFWMTSSGAGSQNCHAGIIGGGFGSTIRTINGGLECDGKNPGTVQARVNAYKSLCNLLGVDPGANTGC